MSEEAAPKVNVTLFVMSRCPDAVGASLTCLYSAHIQRICEGVFESVLKEPGVVDKVDLSLQMVGACVSYSSLN